MIGTGTSRKGLGGAAFVVLAGSWYLANLFAAAASFRTQRAADARIVATGHEPVFVNLPSLWNWQQNLRPALFGILGAAILAVLLRRALRGPWFLLAGALPIVIGRGDRIHGWWAAGAGIDQWTFGAGVGIPGRLDLTRFGAGPSWALAAGTSLAVAAVVLPAICAGGRATPRRHREQLVRALPYVGLLSVAAALATGELHIDSSGDGSSHEMLLAAAAAALIGMLTALVTPERRPWSHVSAVAVAVGLLMVSGLHPGAMLTTKAAAFGAAAGVAIVAGWIARRPRLTPMSPRQPQPATEPLRDRPASGLAAH